MGSELERLQHLANKLLLPKGAKPAQKNEMTPEEILAYHRSIMGDELMYVPREKPSR